MEGLKSETGQFFLPENVRRRVRRVLRGRHDYVEELNRVYRNEAKRRFDKFLNQSFTHFSTILMD